LRPLCRTDGWEKGVLRAYRAECVGSMPEVRPRRRIDMRRYRAWR
jgi:hypothetical protein